MALGGKRTTLEDISIGRSTRGALVSTTSWTWLRSEKSLGSWKQYFRFPRGGEAHTSRMVGLPWAKLRLGDGQIAVVVV